MKSFKEFCVVLGIAIVGCFISPHTVFCAHADMQQQVIQEVMSYQMAPMMAVCQKEYKYSDEDMLLLEKELKRWLVLVILAGKGGEDLDMYSKDVDYLWHSCILFTEEYKEFCDRYAGFFIHHAPKIGAPDSQDFELLHKKYKRFITYYEEVFNEPIHPIWLLDEYETSVGS